MNNKAVIS